ncbi:lysophospholipid acyltransferase family protein [Salinispira pacifica]|uniref:1-acyl-sn-glycerol-3-phosphate acyltransferase n=1 Tax=Salinispira pacifica TaxID=1307761 RepID=V5WHX5_9SPIO|nr:lysophospholipid acyltransferase family protein [Salinispira pacifica]AHC14771.1 1-acyl-sn-glycerol-3-phosphate acyltransferase [Salinispira pacifica]
MILIFYLSMVLVHLISVDIRIAWAKLLLPRDRAMRMVERIAESATEFILRWGRKLIGLDIRQEPDHINLPDQFIVVANHQSLLDILAALHSFPGKGLRFVAKRELGRHVPGASRVLRYGRHPLINRYTNFRETADILSSFSRLAKRRGFNPAVFPEGTRSRDGSLKKFNPGAYRIIQTRTMLPTVVLAIDGGSKYSHFTDFLRKNDYLYRTRILGVIPAPESKDEIKKDLERAREMIAGQLEIWRSPSSAR